MLPAALTAEKFARYAPQARELAVRHLPVLQQTPLSFLPSMLRELIEYDYKFPTERSALDAELRALDALTPKQMAECFHDFAQIRLSQDQERIDWVNRPTEFSEQLSAYLWATHQMDAYRAAATAYGDRMRASLAGAPPSLPRLGVAVIGQGVASYHLPLFRNLRKHGTYFTRIKPEHGLEDLLRLAADRAEAHPVPYGHWYIDGGTRAECSASLTPVSYASLGPVREALLKNIEAQVSKPGVGPEELRDHLVQLSPADLGMHGDPVLDRFQLRLLTEGSGTQIFSTTFAQWAAREAMRRAEALTVVVRFAPRQRQRPMNELLSSSPGVLQLDPVGSLVDADMAAYYQWINQQRLPGADHSAFIACFEGKGEAVAIGPSLPRGAVSQSALDVRSLVTLALG